MEKQDKKGTAYDEEKEKKTMTHFSVLVPARDEDELFQRLLPYYEYGCSVELDELIQPYLQFEITHHRTDFRTDAEVIVKDAEGIKSEHLDDYRRWLAAGDFAWLFETWEGGEINAEGDWGYWHNPNAKWDWYQLGGRFTGILNDGYNPREDLANWEACWLCHGTGDRPGWVSYKLTLDSLGKPVTKRTFTDNWAEKCNGCNGCNGKGLTLKWPGNWRKVDSDSPLVKSVNFEALRLIKLRKAEEDWAAFMKAVTPEFIRAGCIFNEAWDYIREHNLRDWMWAYLDTLKVDKDMKAHWDHDYLLGEDRELYVGRKSATLTWALITIDGEYVEKAEMGFFGMHSEIKKETLRQFTDAYWKELLSWSPEQRMWVMDCHI